MTPTTPAERPPGADEGTEGAENRRSDATAPDALRDADASVVGVYLPDEETLECRRCHLERTSNGAGPDPHTISESELTFDDSWRCSACHTDLRTCARIERVEAALEVAVSTIASQRDELRRIRKHLANL